MTLKCLRSEETAQYPEPPNTRHKVRTRRRPTRPTSPPRHHEVGPPSPPGRSAPVRGDVAPEAGVIGACTTGGGGVESLCGAAEGVMLVVGPRQVLRALAAGHTRLVPGREGDHPTATARAPAPRRHAAVRGGLRLRGRRPTRSTCPGGIIHAVTRGIIHGNTVIHCVIQHARAAQRVRRTALARTASIPEPRRRRASADLSSSTSPASERLTPSERIQAMRSSSWSSE